MIENISLLSLCMRVCIVRMCVAVDLRQEMLEEAQRKLMNLLNSTEGKIDK